MKKNLIKLASLLMGVLMLGASVASVSSAPRGVEAATGDIYNRITDSSSIADGDMIVITNSAKTYALDTLTTSGTLYSQEASNFTISDTELKVNAATGAVSLYELTVEEATSGGFKLKLPDSSYLHWSSGNTLTSDSTGSTWTFSKSDTTDCIRITHGSTTSRFLQYNASAKRFACYQSTSEMADVAIWRRSSVTLSSISINTAGAETAYGTGDSWDFSGLTLTATYSDGTNSTIDSTSDAWSDITWEVYDAGTDGNVVAAPTAEGIYYVQATYLGMTARAVLTITFTARTVTEIVVNQTPTKTSYGCGEVTDYTGITLYVSYSDDDVVEVSDKSLMSFNPAEGTALTTPGEQVVTVTYEGCTDTFTLNVTDSISGTYTLTMSNLTSKSGTQASWEFKYVNVKWLKNDSQTNINTSYSDIRVYTDHTVTFTPAENTVITSISYQYNSSKKNAVTANEWSNAASVTGTNSSDTSGSVTPNIGSQPLVLTKTAQTRFDSITIAYTYTAPIEFGTLDRIEALTYPALTTYEVGDTFDSTGVSVTAYDTAGQSEVVHEGLVLTMGEQDLANYTFADADVGTHEVKISYTLGEVTASIDAAFTVTVNDGPIHTYILASGDMTITSPNHKTEDGIFYGFSGAGNASWDSNGRGQGFNSNNNLDDISIKASLIGNSEKSAISLVKVTAAKASASKGSMSVYVEGKKIGETVTLTNSSVEYSFEAPTPMVGHIEIKLHDTVTNAKYISQIKVYASVDESGIYDVLSAVEAFNSCNFTEAEREALLAKYDNLSPELKTQIDSMMIDDFASDPTRVDEDDFVFRLCSVITKLEAIRARDASDTASTGLLGLKDNSSIAVISVISLAALCAVSSLVLINKKRRVN